MAEPVRLPELGFDTTGATIGVWLKQVGDPVSIGDALAEIESDKVTQELTASHSGILLAQLVPAGVPIPVGSDICIIGLADEEVPDSARDPAAQDARPPEAEKRMEEPAIAATHRYAGMGRATPVARRLASEMGIDLAEISGSGPNGRIRKDDVKAFGQRAAVEPKSEGESTVLRPESGVTVRSEGPASVEESVVEPTRLRRAIAQRMAESKRTVPHFQVSVVIDMTDALKLREQINLTVPDGERVSVNDLVVKACGKTLRHFPNLNARWDDEKIIRRLRINVGIAVAVEGGLLTVVSKNTDAVSLSHLARQNREMIGRARSGHVQAEDVLGSTFTVSNLGAFDVVDCVAIINPPEAAILAVGTARAEPVVVDDQIAIRQMMRVTCSADHRVTDGVEVARFLQAIKALLEAPLQILL